MAPKSSTGRRFVLYVTLVASCLGVGWARATGESGQSAPDNTRTNAHQRASSAPTADQQKENPSDRAISQQIRKAIMKNKSLSGYAHNIKIITQNGQVTLAGPVRSEKEKKVLETTAANVAGGGNVTSQLQVAAKQ
jgi:hyperosmotically inducible periplasmic protein